LGILFSVTTGHTITVSQVGYWDNGDNGVQSTPISVAIFSRNAGALDNTMTGSLVAGSEIDFSGAQGSGAGSTYLSGRFRVDSLSSPVTLTAGDYAVVAWGFSSPNDIFINGASGSAGTFDTLNGALALVGSAYSETQTPGAFPNFFDSNR